MVASCLALMMEGRWLDVFSGSPVVIRNDNFTIHTSPVYSEPIRREVLGLLLKKRQRDLVLKEGIDLVKWTFDPLQAGNAYFNIRKLGAIAREYHRDLYGRMPDSLNKFMISDRFEAEWWIRTRRVNNMLHGKKKHLSLSQLKAGEAGLINETEIGRASCRERVENEA